MADTILIPKDTPDWQSLLSDVQASVSDAENYALATSSFTDRNSNNPAKGSKGWALDAETYKNDAESSASNAATSETNAAVSESNAANSESNAFDSATLAKNEADRAASASQARSSQETRSHGVTLSSDNVLKFILDKYADGQNGDGSFSGASLQYALPGVSELEVEIKNAGASFRVGIAGGQTYKENIDITDSANVDNLVTGVQKSPGDDPPLIDCSDELKDGDWTATGGTSNVYQQSKADPTGSGDSVFPRVFEDDDELEEKTTVSDVDSVPGSYYVDISSDPYIIYLHPKNSTDPSSDGKKYEWTARVQGVRLGPAGFDANYSTVRGIHTRRNLGDNGSIVVGAGSTIDRCLMEDGGKHHALHGGGAIRDSVFYGYSPNKGPRFAIGVVYFNSASVGTQPTIIENTIFLKMNGEAAGEGSNPLSNSAHGGFGPMEMRGSVFYKTPEGPKCTPDSVLEGLYGYRIGSFPNTNGDITIRYSMIDDLERSANNISPDKNFTIEDSVILDILVTRKADSTGYTGTFKNCVIISSGKRMFEDISGNDRTLDFQDCIIINHGKSDIARDHSIQGQNCIFFHGNPGTETYIKNGKSLSTLQNDTGSFSNSVWVDAPQFRNLFNGKWREGGFDVNENAEVYDASGTVIQGKLPDGTPIEKIGPNERWDYHRREAVSEQPSQWPTPPTTLKESKDYIKAPGSWPWRNNDIVDHTFTDTLQGRLLGFWKMDGSAGSDETDSINSNKLFVNTGSPGEGTNSDFEFRRTDGSNYFRTTSAYLSGGFNGHIGRFWLAFVARINGGSGEICSYYRSFKNQGWEIKYDGSDLQVKISQGYDDQSVTPTITPSGSGFLVHQLWVDPETYRVGYRVNGAETIIEEGSGRGIQVHASNESWNVGGANVDIGPIMMAQATPKKKDREWLENGNGFRSLSEIQNREVKMKDSTTLA